MQFILQSFLFVIQERYGKQFKESESCFHQSGIQVDIPVDETVPMADLYYFAAGCFGDRVVPVADHGNERTDRRGDKP